MRAVQGTWAGIGLEDAQVQVYGWTQGNFTASTDRNSNLPYGMNYKANQFLLEQNWLRIDRTVRNSGTTEPTLVFAPIGFCPVPIISSRCRAAFSMANLQPTTVSRTSTASTR